MTSQPPTMSIEICFFHAKTPSSLPLMVQTGLGQKLNKKLNECIRQDLKSLHPVLHEKISLWNRRFDRVKTLNVPLGNSREEKLRLAEWVVWGFELSRMVNEFLVNNPWSLCDAYYHFWYQVPLKAMYDFEDGPDGLLDPLDSNDNCCIHQWLQKTKENLGLASGGDVSPYISGLRTSESSPELYTYSTQSFRASANGTTPDECYPSLARIF